jgi:glycerol-3-phosphate acyltransferase PlsX
MGKGRSIRIALDGMGGDHAPREVVRGALDAVRRGGVEVILVGEQGALEAELAACQGPDAEPLTKLPIVLHHTDQFIEDGESPASGLRAKTQASIAVCARLAKEGHADAAVTMGHTGAAMIAGHWTFGELPGVRRPVVGGPFLPFAPQTSLFDAGANADCRPEQFLQFAAVGVAYTRAMLGIADPTVAVLSNGTERSKGTAQTRSACELLERSQYNFVGYVEGWDLARGGANVVLCDGFLGNVLIKYSEGLGGALAGWLSTRLSDQLPRSQVDELIGSLRAMMEIEEQIGGGPLLGVDGVLVIGHGRSSAPGVARAIEQARRMVESNLVEELRAELVQVAGTLSARD